MHFDTLVVGGGQAGVQVAHSLRELQYTGTIAIIDAQDCAPYERPPLSKGYLRGEKSADDLLFRPSSYWDDADIKLLLGRRVNSIDLTARAALLDDDSAVTWGHLVWAAGGEARQLPLGQGLDGVHSLRDIRDADQLRTDLDSAQDAVIIGGGFIGLEAAAAFRLRGLSVTVIEAQDRLLARVTSPVVSDFYLRMHRDAGVDVRLNAGVQAIEGADGRVSHVVLADGERLEADIVLVGIGQVANIKPLADAGIRCGNGVEVDIDCRTSHPSVFACGDCASQASQFSLGPVRLESVPNATAQAKTVAAGVAGASSPSAPVPWFWSHQYDTRLQTVGLLAGYDDLVVRGDPAEGAFSVVYLRDHRVIALDCINTVRDFAQGKPLVAAGVCVSREVLSDASSPLKNALAAIPA